MKKIYLLLLLPFLSGCLPKPVTVYTEYYSYENLASWHVHTPDPCLNCPPVGERFILSWSLPKKYLEFGDLHFQATIRLRNREEKVFNIPITKRTGRYVYRIMNDQFFQTGGVLTYKVELIGDNHLLGTWCHHLWSDLIEIETEEEDISFTDSFSDSPCE